MHFLDYNEKIEHRTGEFPLAYYYVDGNHPRYRMRAHWHRESEMIRVKHGHLELYLGEQPIALEAGESVLLGEGVLHGGEPEVDCVYECIVFDPSALLAHTEPCRSIVRDNSGKTFCFPNDGKSGISHSVETMFGFASRRELVQTLGMLYVLFGSLPECEPFGIDMNAGHYSVKSNQLKPAIEFIEQNYASKITLDTLARLTGLSPKYFCKLFRSVVRLSPIEYINRYRIECASNMLRDTDYSVADIAQMCGFSDSSFFIKQFKNIKHSTPHRFRTEENGAQ